MPAFPSWRSSDVTTTVTEAAQRTSDCSSLLIYQPQKDERLSWPSWLTYSGWLTHISGHPSATSRAQDSESTSAKDQCSTTGPHNQLIRGVANIAILDLSKAISRKRCKIGGKSVLITNRKSYISFRLVPKSVTLNDVMAIILRYFSEFGSFRGAQRKSGSRYS